MTDSARRKKVRRGRVGVYHCWNRCVRRAFLCGRDPFTGQDFSHCRDLILHREELFAIEIEDEISGRFWQGRFGCRELTDVNSILLCGIYVDLNPIKAGEAASPRTARYTSAYQRMQALGQRPQARHRSAGWLGELTWRDGDAMDETTKFSSCTGRRASDLGLLPISLEDYLAILHLWSQDMPPVGNSRGREPSATCLSSVDKPEENTYYINVD